MIQILNLSMQASKKNQRLGHVAAAWKRSHQWCVSLTPNNTKTIERMTCHCFLRPLARDLMSSCYTTVALPSFRDFYHRPLFP